MTRENAAPNRLFLWLFGALALVVVAWGIINSIEPDPLPRSEVIGRYFYSRTITETAELDKLVAYVQAEHEAELARPGPRFLPDASSEHVDALLTQARARGSARVSIDLVLAEDHFTHEAFIVFGPLDASIEEKGDWGTTENGIYLHDPLQGSHYRFADGVLQYRYHGLTLPLERRPLDSDGN